MAKGRKTGGRRPGSRNKATQDVKALAQPYSAEAIETLAAIMRNAEMPPQARVAASNGLLDRAFGKPAQALTGEGGGPVSVTTTVIHQHLGESA